jgi:ABC-2 type transport system ATP-binding protein
MTNNVIEVEGLRKEYRGRGRKRVAAIDNLDLAIPEAGVFGFLGPNGSGKTTTIRMLLGLVTPTAGHHELLGVPMPGGGRVVLPRVGALVEGPAFHPYLSGRDNLLRLDAADRSVAGRTAGARVDEALDRVGLRAAAGKRYRVFSLGMRQRLAIAAALLRPRELLILDEPTNGLDPQGTREVRTLLAELAADGTTVLLSTHLLSEVEQICTDVGVMHLGRLVAQGRLADLRAGVAPTVEVETTRPDDAVRVLTELKFDEVAAHGPMVTAKLGGHQPEEIAPALVAADVPIRGIRVQRADLEDLFVSLTGEGFDVSG